MGAVIGAADLQHAAVRIDPEVTRHAGQLIAVEQDEGAIALAGAVKVDGLIEALRAEVVGVELPDVAVLSAGRLQSLAVALGEQLGTATVAGHRGAERVDHFLSMSWATFGARSSLSMWLPWSKLSSARNFNLAAYFVRTRPATSRWRKAVWVRSALRTTSTSWPSRGMMKAVAWRRSGDMRTSVTLTRWLCSVSSWTSPRARISLSTWRTCSPTRSTRTERPSGVSTLRISESPPPCRRA